MFCTKKLAPPNYASKLLIKKRKKKIDFLPNDIRPPEGNLYWSKSFVLEMEKWPSRKRPPVFLYSGNSKVSHNHNVIGYTNQIIS